MNRSTQLGSSAVACLLLFSQIMHPVSTNEKQSNFGVAAVSKQQRGIHERCDFTDEPSLNESAGQPADDTETIKDSSTGDNLSPDAAIRRDKIRRCLSIYFTKYMNAERLSPWSLMHALLAYGGDTHIAANGKTVNALAYLCSNGAGRDHRLFTLQRQSLQARTGPNVQGHDGQFLAMLAQSNVPLDYPIRVDGRDFTVRHLIEFEQRGCRSKEECTFQLIGLAHYLASDAIWKNSVGEHWSIPQLIKEELSQPIIGAACGGTHRLMALSYAVQIRTARGEPINGPWFQAAEFVNHYHDVALRLQNRDGSFSTNFFDGPGRDSDLTRRLYTTGHILEWLVFSLPEDRLHSPQVTRAVDYLLNLMLEAPNYSLSVGPRGHALRALRLYQHRAFGEADSYRQAMLAHPIGTAVTNTVDDPGPSAGEQKTQRRWLFRRR